MCTIVAGEFLFSRHIILLLWFFRASIKRGPVARLCNLPFRTYFSKDYVGVLDKVVNFFIAESITDVHRNNIR